MKERHIEERDLDKLLKAYRLGMISQKDLEERIYVGIREKGDYFHLNLLHGEMRSDYIHWLYPRLKNAIERYRDVGSTFDAYIAALVRFTIREYTSRIKKHRIMENSWWRCNAEHYFVKEEEEEYDEKPPSIRNKRQVLILILKSYQYLSDHHLEKYAKALKMSKEKLEKMISSLRGKKLRQEEAFRKLCETMHSQYYRCIGFERRLAAFDAGSEAWHKTEKSLALARRRLLSIRRRVRVMRTEATNREIADIMGISKGTVDSCLFAAKQKLTRAPRKD
ncbi:MAG: hypothetical protein LBJ31_01005 [Treponema sp.]|jgi:DNA-directed RNA polymerase specialized sigma24 family protein|nr:hypothetical protein [Treponema sp.]